MQSKNCTEKIISFVKKILVIFFFLIGIKSTSQSTCAGTVVDITFGNGNVNPGPELSTVVSGASTTYNFASYATGNPPATPNDGDYALLNQVPQHSASAWHTGATDHTGDPNGYMAFFNASPTPGEFYRQNITGLVPNTTYEFSSWIANVINPAVFPGAILPNITFQILDTPTQSVLASFNTGDIPTSTIMTWIRYGLQFTVPLSLNAVTLRLSNNNIGGNQAGNDLALDDIVFSPCLSALPLNLISFKGNLINNSITLTWTTFNESNTASNIIERSYNGLNFASIGSLPALNSSQENSYQFTDYPVFINKNVFYRLKFTDKDGKYTYSNILVFSLGNQVSDGIKLLPNPTKPYVQLTYTSKKEEFTKIKILDMTGKIIIVQPTYINRGVNTITINSINRLQRGVYYVQFFVNNKILTSKLVIN